MNIMNEETQRNEFRSILLNLAKDQIFLQKDSERQAIFNRLEQLYHPDSEEKGFRHFYSDIFMVLTKLQQENNLGDISILGQNLEIIRREYKPTNYNITDELRKLYDHVNLDIARISYSDKGDRKISGEAEIQEIKSKTNEIDIYIGKMRKDIENAEKKLSNQQKEYITILGIFAAIVMAFTGGIAFSSSVLENLHLSSIYRIVIVSCIIGMVVIGVIGYLIDFIRDINNINNKKWCKTYLIVVSTLLVIILFTCCAYKYDLLSKEEKINGNSVKIERNIEVTNNYQCP